MNKCSIKGEIVNIMSKFKIGDFAYVSDCGWKKVQIIRVSGNYYHVKRLDKQAAFGVSEHRLLSEKEYESIAIIEKEAENHPPLLH